MNTDIENIYIMSKYIVENYQDMVDPISSKVIKTIGYNTGIPNHLMLKLFSENIPQFNLFDIGVEVCCGITTRYNIAYIDHAIISYNNKRLLRVNP